MLSSRLLSRTVSGAVVLASRSHCLRLLPVAVYGSRTSCGRRWLGASTCFSTSDTRRQQAIRAFAFAPAVSVQCRAYSSDSKDDFSLDDLFSELQAVDTSTSLNKNSRSPKKGEKKGGVPKKEKGNGAAVNQEEKENNDDVGSLTSDRPSSEGMNSKQTSTDSEESIPPAERAQMDHLRMLQRQVEEAREEEVESAATLKDTQRTDSRKTVSISPPAAIGMSSAELIQEKSPQHFISLHELRQRGISLSEAGGTDDLVPALPPLPSGTGHVAMVTLVGEVIENRGVYEDGPNGVYGSLVVQYTIPLAGGAEANPVVITEVRCYGTTLSNFSEKHVEAGDVVHVLGHLLPVSGSTAKTNEKHATETEEKSCGFAICALPLGGNISVLVPKALENDDSNTDAAEKH